MKNKIYLLSLAVILYACSAADKSESKEVYSSPEIYIFDDVENVEIKIDTARSTINNSQSYEALEVLDNNTIDSTVNKNSKYFFVVQLGAFSSEKRALEFISVNQSKTEIPLTVNFNPNTKFYVVQTSPFERIEDAEKYKNRIAQYHVFQDAFIITIEE